MVPIFLTEQKMNKRSSKYVSESTSICNCSYHREREKKINEVNIKESPLPLKIDSLRPGCVALSHPDNSDT